MQDGRVWVTAEVTMKPVKWSPKLFANLLKGNQSPLVRRAYQIQRIRMQEEGHNPKLLTEWEMFVKFCEAFGLEIDPAEVEMLDANSSNPPPPDLRCPLLGHLHYFELGEVIQEDLAKDLAAASAYRRRQRVLRGPLPLARVLAPLETMLAKKFHKRYNPNASPLSLLLYYATDGPFWECLEPLITERRDVLRAMFKSSNFDFVWVFDATAGEVRFSLARPSLLIAK